jgi:hypothetical protein
VAAGVLLLVGTTPASADEPYVHDGFYLRAGAGASSVYLGRETRAEGSGQSTAFVGDRSSLRNLGFLGELSIGATPFRRVAIAGTVLLHVVEEPELDLADGSNVALSGPFALLFVGPTADVFPRPAGGFHIGGGPGLLYARGSLADGRFDHIGGLGGGVTVTAGYDVWVDRGWSVGLGVRALLGGVYGSQSQGTLTGTESDTVTFYGLSLTALRN